MFVHLRNVLFVFCSAVFISACSGSGSSGLPSKTKVEDETESTADKPSVLSISGNIVKGTVKNAQVDFYLVREGLVDSAPLATVYSDDTGEFSAQLDMSDTADLILITAVGLGNQQTQMLCDAAQCGTTQILDAVDSNDDGLITWGETLYLSEAFHLSTAVVIPENSDTLRTSVTPLTHIAVSQARNQALLTRESVEMYMQRLATLMNLPTTLTQLTAINSARLAELIAAGGAELEDSAFIYSVYAGMFAEYANQHQLTIEAAIQDVEDRLFSDTLEVSFDRNMVLIILQNALEVAYLYAGQDQSLQALIAEIQLLLQDYYCNEYAVNEDCDVIDPVVPEVPDEAELQVVKNFVADLRKWGRDVTLQAEPAVDKFINRLSLVEGVWEDDLQLLSSSLNDLLPGIAQLVSPYYCGNYADCPYVEYIDFNHRRLTWRGLQYDLYSDTREITITGELDGRVAVDIDLQLPTYNNWAQEHRIAVSAGRLSHGDADLLLTEGSEIIVGFANSLSFSALMRQISSPFLSPMPSTMTFAANFLLQAEYERAVQGTMGFEPNENDDYLPVDFGGNWFVTTDRASSGEASLRSRAISHRQSSRATARFNTKGGNLEFYSAIESESSFDFLRVYVDGRRVLSFSGYQPQFRRNVVYIPPGEHTVSWEYSKDGSVNRYTDAAWIDRITFPPFEDSDLPTEFETRTVLSGDLELAAEKLDQPWVWATKGFLPANISIDATLASDFDLIYEDGSSENARDSISLRLAANVANAADFVPPQEFDEGAFGVLGDYGIDGDLFTLTLPNQRFEVEWTGWFNEYHYRAYRDGESEPVDSRYYYLSEVDDLVVAAGMLINNSAIGWSVVMPEEGLYISTLLGSSPWGFYPDSRFDPDGGNVFGYLVEGYEPTETESQYLRLSAALEIEAQIEGLQNTILGTAFSRDNLNQGKLGFYIEYDGHRFNVESDAWYTPVLYEQDSVLEARDPSLSITNQAGVELFVELDITLDGEDDEQDKENLSGQISYKGSVYATLERIKGLTVIRYIDGTGESLE
ncbi:MAG: hypothetical protein KTR17_08240 [Cellvibrionaceae bacterium]|nr:hypothetical protein [Cellvibrionaceae bacterium]